MQNSGNNFIFKKPPNYFPKSAALLFHHEQILELNSGKNFEFFQISQANPRSAWNKTISIENGNNIFQPPNSCNHQRNFENNRPLHRTPLIHAHELINQSPIPQNPYLAGSTAVVPHTNKDHVFFKNYLANPQPSFRPVFRCPHHLSPPPYHNAPMTAGVLKVPEPHGPPAVIPYRHPRLEMLPSVIPYRQARLEMLPAAIPVVTKARLACDEAILTEKEIDSWVSKIAEEANSHVFVSGGPNEVKVGNDEMQRENLANTANPQEPRRRRERKQTKPQCSVKRHDPNFKGMVVEMHITVEGNKCQMRMHSSLGVKMGSLRLASNVRHILRRSCCSSDEQSNANRRFAPRPQTSTVRCVKECQSCGSRKTQMWRPSENGKLLCNICCTRYNKYRIRCSRCWHVPRQYGKLQSRCGCCGSSLCYVISKQRVIRCSAQSDIRPDFSKL